MEKYDDRKGRLLVHTCKSITLCAILERRSRRFPHHSSHDNVPARDGKVRPQILPRYAVACGIERVRYTLGRISWKQGCASLHESYQNGFSKLEEISSAP